jgi:hypothetical protein
VPDIHPVEEEIIRYVNDNPGCSKSDVVRFIKEKQMMGRPAVLVHIDKLEREGMIICELEKPNSQLYKIYINKENKITSVLGDLEMFKRVYYNLLQKSKERIDDKDYSEAAKHLGIGEPDPSKWHDEDKLKYLRMESEKHTEHGKTYVKTMIWLDRSKEDIHKLMDKTPDLDELYNKTLGMVEKLPSESDPNRRRDLILRMNKFLSSVERDINEIRLPLYNHIQSLYNVQDYEVVFLLNYAVYIYYWFVEIMVFRTIFVWPNNTKDKQTFSSVYSIIYRIISEIYLQLVELFRNNKLSVMAVTPTKNIAYIIRLIRDNNLQPDYLGQYYTLNMGSWIKSVANSLLRLSEEINDYDYIDMGNFEFISHLEEIFEISEVYNMFLKFIERSKNITEVEINSPEYRRQSELAMQAVKKLIQLQTRK